MDAFPAAHTGTLHRLNRLAFPRWAKPAAAPALARPLNTIQPR